MGFVLFGLGAWFLVALVLTFVTQERIKKGRNTSEIACCQPLTGRLSMMMLAVWFIVAYPLMYVGGMFHTGAPGSAMEAETWFLGGLLELMCIAVGIPIYRVSGPDDLYINLDRRSYRLVHGWPHAPTTETGSLDDLAGVFVYCRSMNANYPVGIVWKSDWKPGQKWYVLMGAFNRSGRADRFAEETAATLGLPLVPPPPQLKSSSNVRNGLG